jgi:hypothetical protein
MTEYLGVDEETDTRIRKSCKPYFIKHREWASLVAMKKQRARELNKEAYAHKNDPKHFKATMEYRKEMIEEIKVLEAKMDEFMIAGNVCVAKAINEESPEEPYEAD